MVDQRASPEINAQISQQAVNFAQLFFTKQSSDKETLHEMYHHQASLTWNGQPHKTKSSITRFYQDLQPLEMQPLALDAQMGDSAEQVIIMARGKIRQAGVESNFGRHFLVGPSSSGAQDYLIISDNVRINP